MNVIVRLTDAISSDAKEQASSDEIICAGWSFFMNVNENEWNADTLGRIMAVLPLSGYASDTVSPLEKSDE